VATGSADAVAAFEMPEEMVDTVEETTERAVGWARAAGRTPDEAAVAAAVGQYVGPFAESVDAFLRGLGFRFGERLADAAVEGQQS
jgi:hypothetical protein